MYIWSALYETTGYVLLVTFADMVSEDIKMCNLGVRSVGFGFFIFWLGCFLVYKVTTSLS